ncbi:extracellular solute-binding protein [Cohnella sp. CBP 2801]|uniref:Extracellular solute-binding protein n=2 Tax=Cohnella zeiphila TaxID=2761120 RepID=A0A7X0VV12_9BACL|nr:extracellular solute-binding protein [Cohnella zeiphila]MBB6729443.1 extracellular solute-binding protein [Cohnella zeiphila]
MSAILAVSVMASAVAAGCSSNDNNAEGKESQAANSPSGSPSGSAASATPSADKPLKFSISYPTTLNDGYAQRQSDLSKEKWVQALNKLTNTEQIPTSIQVDNMPVMFAGNDIPDVVVANNGISDKSLAGAVQAGVFMPLEDLLKQYAPDLMKNVPQSAWDLETYKGHIYGVPDYLSNPNRRATFIRTDLLEKAGLPAPKTVDDFLNVLRAFKKLGVENPYQMRADFKYADVILGAYDVLPYKDQFEVVDGQVVPKFFDADNMEKALTTMKTMFDEGLIAKDFATVDVNKYFQNIRGGSAGVWSQNAISMPDFVTNLDKSTPGSKVDIIPSPVGPEGKGGYFFYAPVTRAAYINKKVDPDKAIDIIKYLNWMQSDEANYFFTFGTEGDTYTKDADGKVNYKIPETKEEIDEEGWRGGTLFLAHDGTMNRLRLDLDDTGKYVENSFDTVLANEGLPGIGFYPDLSAFSKYPDLTPQTDVGPKLIVDHMVKMVYGKEPISNWPKVIEEYKSKGGDEIVKEATERYNNKDGVVDIER